MLYFIINHLHSGNENFIKVCSFGVTPRVDFVIQS